MTELFEGAPRGLFITLEGIDGCGKTTQAELLELALIELGRTCVRLREPGGTAISEQIRTLLLDPDNAEMAPEAELMLYEASRAQLVRERIEPALAEGSVVICDRFYDSTFAYQATARGLDEGVVRRANELGSCGVRPARTIVLDLDPEVAYKRATANAVDRLEAEGLEFQRRVRAGYARVHDIEKRRVHIVDASGDVAEVFRRIVGELSDVLPELQTLNASTFLAVQSDLERAFAEVEAAAAAGAARKAEEAARAKAEAEARARAEAEAAAQAEAAAAEAEARAQAEAEAEAQAQMEARAKAEAEAQAQAQAEEEARAQAEAEARAQAEAQAAAEAEAAAAAEAQRRAEAEAREREEAIARQRRAAFEAEEAALFAQIEAKVAAEAQRLSTLNSTEFAQEAREAEADAMASLDVIEPYGGANV